MQREDTIAQIATAAGSGGVGVVRISGPLAHGIGRTLVRLQAAPIERQALLRSAFDVDGSVLDQGLYLEFHGPRSFTGEDVAEFQGHAGAVGLACILRRCQTLGARPAEPGEFSLRAFLHGKMDLTQAEAVAQAVAAETEVAHRLAQRQARGDLSRRVLAIRAPLVAAASTLGADVEFPDDQLAALDRAAVTDTLGAAAAGIRELRAGYRAGRLIRQGAIIAIVGPPNAGKSSLLNALLGFERAIVSPFAGTTRDTIEERLVVDGLGLRLVDSAGLHAEGDVIEAAGMTRSRELLGRADLVLAVLSPDSAWRGFCAEMAARELGAAFVWVRNKADVGATDTEFGAAAQARGALSVSARTGAGCDELRQALRDTLVGTAGAGGEPLVTIERHALLLDEALVGLERAAATLAAGLPPELVLVDVNISIHRLGAVLGENLSEAVLADIFQRFCIGK